MPPFLIESLQRLGHALMLPIAVLSIAGLPLRLGGVDLLDIPLVHDTGKAIFANLTLIFAIGIAVGLARDDNGTADPTGAIGYSVMILVLKVIDPGIDMGMFSGIISDLVVGAPYNHSKDVKLPEYPAFFGGRRFAPIVTGIGTVCLGLLFGVIWPPLQQGTNGLDQLMLESGSFGAFAFGVLNRLLIVIGLHHILDNLVRFVFGSFTDSETGRIVIGDLTRYFADDPKGGQFMAGVFPVMMFGLPVTCLAMYRNTRPGRCKLIDGLLPSMALTALLAGVTEPVEFAFVFLTPLFYLLHALLTGLSMVLTDLLDIRLSFTFSGGAIDLALGQGRSTHGWMLWPLGLLYAGIYHPVFDFCIRCLNLKTPGREDDASSKSGDSTETEHVPTFICALGGAANLEVVDACTTRLRLRLVDHDKASDAQPKVLGAIAMIRPGEAGSLQVVVGPQTDSVIDKIRRALPFDTQSGEAIPPLGGPNTAKEAVSMQATVSAAEAQAWPDALGDAGNLHEVRDVALTRLRVSVADERKLVTEQLCRPGGQGVSSLAGGICHILVGPRAAALSQALQPLLRCRWQEGWTSANRRITAKRLSTLRHSSHAQVR